MQRGTTWETRHRCQSFFDLDAAELQRSSQLSRVVTTFRLRTSILIDGSRGRYVPAAERREVFRRDEGRCTFTDERGQRCREERYLELHHLKPFAPGGENVASNLTLRCAAHNALAAEDDFGR